MDYIALAGPSPGPTGPGPGSHPARGPPGAREKVGPGDKVGPEMLSSIDSSNIKRNGNERQPTKPRFD